MVNKEKIPINAVMLLRIFIPFAAGYFLSYLYRSVNAIIAPNLVIDLGLNPSNLGLLTSAYFITFAFSQLPLGLLLDRYGPRRVESFLLLIAATGAFVFARAESLPSLILGRALIGLGVSACLMAAFKAFVIWLPLERLPLANGIQMVSGGLGALAATTPVEKALSFTDWRGVFMALGLLTLLAAVCIYLVVPERDGSHSEERLTEQIRGVFSIYTSRDFWSIAPWTIASQASFLSIVSLWSGLWLRDMGGYDRSSVASALFGISAAMVLGFFFFGIIADHLRKKGVRPMSVAAVAMGTFIAVQVMLFAPLKFLVLPIWLFFGFFGTASILPYAVLSQTFPRHLSGRVNTSLNVLVFVCAFASQWGIGVVINIWPETAAGGYAPEGYRAGFGMLLVLQLTAAIWYVVARKNGYAKNESAA